MKRLLQQLKDRFLSGREKHSIPKEPETPKTVLIQQGEALKGNEEGDILKAYESYRKGKTRKGELAASFRNWLGGMPQFARYFGREKEGLYYQTIRHRGTFSVMLPFSFERDNSAGGDLLRARVAGREKTRKQARQRKKAA